VLSRPGRYRHVRDNLEIKELTLARGSERRRFVLVRNPEQAARDRAKRQTLLERLEAELDRLNASRRGPGHSKAVCALKSHPAYGRFVEELAEGTLRLDRARLRAEERLDGKYLLSTTDPSLSAEDVALGYKQLLEVERAFRTLKHELDLRPLYHRLDQRIRAHVLLCWLALLLVRVVEIETGVSWAVAQEALEDLALVTLEGKDGRFELLSTLTVEQRNLLNKLALPSPKVARRAPATPASA
jgi:Transposase DDE domain